MALQLADYYSKTPRSRSQWSKTPKQVCNWTLHDKDGGPEGRIVATPQKSNPFHLEDFISDLKSSGAFDHKKYNLPDPMCPWLDGSIAVSTNFTAPSNSGGASLTFRVETNLGAKFPLSPAIDREGVVMTSFQVALVHRIANLRQSLVDTSNATGSEEWFQNFRSLVSETISLVDNTLHQLYFKAEWDPSPGWTFDRRKLGDRHGRRLTDKLAWVFQITGKELQARDERKALGTVKELRNHLQHFDPPCFAASLEEMAGWLNDVVMVARLVWEIRKCVSAMPSNALTALLVQPDVRFVPANPSSRRSMQQASTGYASASALALENGVSKVAGGHVIVLSPCRREELA